MIAKLEKTQSNAQQNKKQQRHPTAEREAHQTTDQQQPP